MANESAIIAGIASIVFQALALFFAWKLNTVTGFFRGWAFIMAALSLMMLRRFTALALQLGVVTIPQDVLAFSDQIVIPLGISILLLAGMADLYRLFSRKEVK
jgi:hypothetical protein